ncbi:MAG: DNA primase [Patescibacteria group bacterium]|nr:DNA primase [bacterium]MDZ4240566.1 DNA primase [Patescibacteria group bacterium]
MSSSNVSTIKEKLDIVDVIGSYVKLTKAGKHYKGLSPFTNEKTPSFFVSSEKGLYYCFSSGKGGDMFSFIQEVEGVDFQGALKMLADKAGVQLVFEPKEKQEERDRLYDLLEKATQFFEENLKKNKEATDYLLKRKLLSQTIATWRIGYAPNEWRALYEAMISQGFNKVDMEKVGLLKKGEEGNPYDTFRDRIIFPIFDTVGRIIAFSGRILHDTPDAPKYLNSPDTVFFNKSQALYGLHRAKTAIRKHDYAILVEGQMDIVLSHQGGFTHTVASSGTALTEGHLTMLKKISNRVVMAYDSDEAGRNASLRAADIALPLGMEVKVATCPQGKDPADVLGENTEDWKEIIKSSKHLIDFYLDKVISENKGNTRSLGKNIKEKVLPYVRGLSSSIEQAHFVKNISNKTNIREEALWQDLGKTAAGKTTEKNTTSTPYQPRLSPRDELVGIVYWQSGLPEPAVSADRITAIVEEYLGKEAVDTLLHGTEGMKEIFTIHVTELYGQRPVTEKKVREVAENYARTLLREEANIIQQEIKIAEEDKNETLLGNLLKKQADINQKIDRLSGIT